MRKSSRRKIQEDEKNKSKTEENDCYSQRSLCEFNINERKACLCQDNDSEPDRYVIDRFAINNYLESFLKTGLFVPA